MERRQKLTLGVRVVFDGDVHVVVGFDGGAVRLRKPNGGMALVSVSCLVGADDFEVIGERDGTERSRPRLLAAELENLPKEARREAEERRAHIEEAVTGKPSAGGGGAANADPRPEYDPELVSLTDRMAAKAREMGVSKTTLWGMKRAYEQQGLYGLVDKRRVRPLTAADRLDPLLRDAFFAVLDELTHESNSSRARVIRRVKARVAKEHGDGRVRIPSDRTLYRALEQLSRGRNTFRSSKARRETANRPATTYRRFRASRPGEVVLIDTTALDVYAVDPLTLKWVSLELTLALDLYTRSILAWRFTPRGTKGVDAALVLRDVITPTRMRPGWPQAAKWPYHGVPDTVLLDVFDEDVAGVPIVHPETVVVDHGRVYESEVFQEACRLLGINVQSARPYAPTDKAQIERTFRTIRQSLLENLPGYKGPDVWSRGKHVEEEAFYFIEEIEEIFAQWVVRYWQVRPHQGLHMPGLPRQRVGPNEMYEYGLATAGFVHVPPSPDFYYELLPIEWRKIGHDGVRVRGLKYDGDAVNEYRNRPSRHGGFRRGKYPIRYDPRDYSRVYFRDEDDEGGWHELEWVDAPPNARPFNDTLLSHAKGLLSARAEGRPSRRSEDLAKVLEEIFDRTERDQVMNPKERKALGNAFMRGPQAARDRRDDYPALGRHDAIEGGTARVEDDEETSVWDADPSTIEPFPVQGRGAEPKSEQEELGGKSSEEEAS